MSLESGLVALINSDPTVGAILALAPGGGQPGGWGFDETPQNLPLPTWSFRFFGGNSTIFLQGSKGFQWRRLEIHSRGDIPDNAVALANAIDNVIGGFSGRLPDSPPFGPAGGTLVDSIFSANGPIDFFDQVPRSWRRVAEYRVQFNPLA